MQSKEGSCLHGSHAQLITWRWGWVAGGGGRRLAVSTSGRGRLSCGRTPWREGQQQPQGFDGVGGWTIPSLEHRAWDGAPHANAQVGVRKAGRQHGEHPARGLLIARVDFAHGMCPVLLGFRRGRVLRYCDSLETRRAAVHVYCKRTTAGNVTLRGSVACCSKRN
jgi:hypothetical protein